MLLARWVPVLALALALAVHPTLLEPVPVKPPETIIDFLSANVEYLYFLRHIQVLGLVPHINAMANVTLFAPVNLAFVDSELAKSDTVESVQRYFSGEMFLVAGADQMVTVLDSMYVVKEVVVEENSGEMFLQRRLDDDAVEGDDTDAGELETSDLFHMYQEVVLERAAEKKWPTKKYFPLLISHQLSPKDKENLYINGVAEIVEPDNYARRQNAYIHGIANLLPTTPTMCQLFMDRKSYTFNGHSMSFISKVFQLLFTPSRKYGSAQEEKPEVGFPRTCDQFLSNASTFFLPTDAYINSSLLELERKYYVTILHGIDNPELYPTKDAVLEMKRDAFALVLKLFITERIPQISGLHNRTYACLDPSLSYNISGNFATGQLTINGALTSLSGYSSLALADGIVYVFDVESEETPTEISRNLPDFFAAANIAREPMIPRKALYAYHFSKLVHEIEFRKLGKFIGRRAQNQTMLINYSDRDDVKEDDDFDSLQQAGIVSFTNTQQLLYRFIDTYVDIGVELTKNSPIYLKMLDSKLCLKKRIGSCYKIKVSGELDEKGFRVSFNDEFESGLPVLAANHNALYFSDNDYEAPASFKRVLAALIAEDLVLSHNSHFVLNKDACFQTIKYLHSYNLMLLDDNSQGYTAFLPCGKVVTQGVTTKVSDNVWEQMGLVLRYLQKHPNKFRDVLQSLFLGGVVYTNPEELMPTRVIQTVGGKNVLVSETVVQEKKHAKLRLNHTELVLPLNSDVLFNQGVIHMTDQLLLPTDFRVTLKDLLETTEEVEFPETSFFRLLERFPSVQKKLHLESPSSEYSLLVPTPESLHWKNITVNYWRLDLLLQMHMVPNSELQPLLDCVQDLSKHSTVVNYTFSTNRTNVSFRCQINPSTGKAYLSLQKPPKTASFAFESQRVSILSYGCTQGKNGTCVFLIDNPISPNWFDVPDNFLHVLIDWISVRIGIVIGVILFGFCITTLGLWLFMTTNKRKAGISQAASTKSFTVPSEPSFMRITDDEDPENIPTDGYETDTDITGDEEQRLLPKRSKRKKKGQYGSVPNGHTVDAAYD